MARSHHDNRRHRIRAFKRGTGPEEHEKREARRRREERKKEAAVIELRRAVEGAIVRRGAFVSEVAA